MPGTLAPLLVAAALGVHVCQDHRFISPRPDAGGIERVVVAWIPGSPSAVSQEFAGLLLGGLCACRLAADAGDSVDAGDWTGSVADCGQVFLTSSSHATLDSGYDGTRGA